MKIGDKWRSHITGQWFTLTAHGPVPIDPPTDPTADDTVIVTAKGATYTTVTIKRDVTEAAAPPSVRVDV